MGCGACGDVNTIVTLLSARLRQPISALNERIKKDTILEQFITNEDLQIVSIFQAGVLEESAINHNLLSNKCLLSKSRRSLWKISIAYSTLKTDIKPHFYTNTPQNTPQLHKSFSDIELDIKRTFPQHSLDQSSLSSVLKNLSKYYPTLGYTQGMNFLIGFFLLCGFSPQQCFWIFVRLSKDPRFLLLRNFTEGFPTVLTGTKLLQKRIDKEQALTLLSTINSLGLNSYFYSFQWVLSYFLYNLSLIPSTMLWDCILLTNCTQPCPQYAQIGGGLLFLVPFAVRLFYWVAEQILEGNQREQESINKLSKEYLHENVTPKITAQLLAQTQCIEWKDYLEDLKEVDQEMYAIASVWVGNKDPILLNKCKSFYQKYQYFVGNTNVESI